jgi:hypothetical protein
MLFRGLIIASNPNNYLETLTFSLLYTVNNFLFASLKLLTKFENAY